MTKAGYVFTGINVLLSIIFGLLLSNVASTRIEGQKRIDGVVKQIEEARKALGLAEQQRAAAGARLVDLRQILASENRVADSSKSEWDNRLTTTTDLLQDARERSNSLKETLAEMQSEVNARAEEIRQLQNVLSEENARFDALAKKVEQLTSQLGKVESELGQMEQNIARDFKTVLTLEASAAGARVADARP